jgi:hypothetical protein
MTPEIDAERIRSFAGSIQELLRSATSESKRSGFAAIEDYIASTRCRTGSIDSSRVEYYAFALNKLREQDSRVGESFALHFISTLNANSSVVDIGAGPIILIDIHQSEVLEEMARLYLTGGGAKQCEAMALRLLAEHMMASDKEALGTYFAMRRSILMEGVEQAQLSADEQTELDRSSVMQDVWVLTHEVAHILWARDLIPKEDFVSLATGWINLDTQMMARKQQKIATQYEGVHTHFSDLIRARKDSEGAAHILSQLSSVIANSGYAPDQIRATVERRCDPTSGFIEEVWADHYAWVSSMQLFSGHWPPQQIYRHLTLALRNLATIDATRRTAEGAVDPHEIDDASARRDVLRIGLSLQYGNLRQNDDSRNAIDLRNKSDWDVDMVNVSLETDERYHNVLWIPMTARTLAAVASLPKEEELALLYAKCQQEFGSQSGLKILRDHPINKSNVGQLFQNELKTIAEDANPDYFAEFDQLMPNLSLTERRLGMRLALLPATHEPGTWQALRTIVLEDTQAEDLGSLKRKNVLETSSPPSYGHAKRSESALWWFMDNSHKELAELCESLVLRLGESIRQGGPEEIPAVSSILTLKPLITKLQLSVVSRAVFDSVLSLVSHQKTDVKPLLDAVLEISKSETNASLATLFSFALYNAIKRQTAPERFDDLINGLQKLSLAFPDDETVRVQFAKALFYALNHAKEPGAGSKQRSELITEFVKLLGNCPQDQNVREWFAKALYVTLCNYKKENNLILRDMFLESLRLLAHDYPEDSFVRNVLADSLLTTMSDAYKEASRDRRCALLLEIRGLAHLYPDDDEIRGVLAKALLNESNYAKFENAFESRDALLDEVRQLAYKFQNEDVSESFATALHNAVADAKEEKTLGRRDALLEELRQLHHIQPDYLGVRKWLVRSLFDTAIDAKEEGDLLRRDALLDELRAFARTYPKDDDVSESLAKGLCNTLIDAGEEHAPQRRGELLDQLRELAKAYPHNRVIYDRLVKGIRVALRDGDADEREASREALEDELRQLCLAEFNRAARTSATAIT